MHPEGTRQQLTVILPRLVVVCSLTLGLLAAGSTLHSESQSTPQNWIDENIPRLLKRYKVPGAAVALVENQEVVWAKGYGLSDIGNRRRTSTDTVFQAASISKSLTAWGVVKLAEQSLIELDAPVDLYLKRWHLPPSPYNDRVTVRRVLSHTAGLSLQGYPGNDPNKPLPTLVQSLSGRNSAGTVVRVVEEPGKGWRYSGGGYTVLELLVEDVTGLTFDKYMEEAVLRPLGMNNSSFIWESRLRAATAQPYSVAPKRLPNYLNPEKAAAGLQTTAPDLARFVAAVTSPSAASVLRPESLRQILAPAPGTSGALGEYGFGVSTERLPSGERVVQHTGGNPGFAAIWIALPDKGTGLVVLTNSNTGSLLSVETACEWSRLTAADTPQACAAFDGFGSFAVGGSAAGGFGIAAYLAVLAVGVSKKRRMLRRPRGFRWVQLVVPPLLSAIWIVFWHTTVVTNALGGSLEGWSPSIAMPSAFRWTSPVVAGGLLLLTISVLFPKKPRMSSAQRAVVASVSGAFWFLFLYTDILSRAILRTAGPRPAALLSLNAELVSTLIVLTIIFVVSLWLKRRPRLGD